MSCLSPEWGESLWNFYIANKLHFSQRYLILWKPGRVNILSFLYWLCFIHGKVSVHILCSYSLLLSSFGCCCWHENQILASGAQLVFPLPYSENQHRLHTWSIPFQRRKNTAYILILFGHHIRHRIKDTRNVLVLASWCPKIFVSWQLKESKSLV